MEILDQIRKSSLSKRGKTNPSGIFEGVPVNVTNVTRGYTVPQISTQVPPIIDPIDVTFDALPQPTYLNYLKAAKTI